MNNLSLANKYRPRKFEDVLGQEPTVKALVGKIKEGRLPRTSLFCGAHGSGKTTLARIVAKAINCEGLLDENGNPCCKCESCQQIDAGVSSDVYELDAASHNKVEDVEKLIKKIDFLPVEGKKKVFIFDEFHMMTKEAQNKLLKIVEEPPAHVIFIFCTTEENRILPTILSRCNKFTFKSISDIDIYHNLKSISDKEGFEYEEDALKLITKAANGHVRDSLSVLEQLAYDKLTAVRVADTLGLATEDQIFVLLQAVILKDTAEVMTLLDEIVANRDMVSFLKQIVYILCYMITYNENREDTETADFRAQVSMLKERCSVQQSLNFVRIITSCLKDNRGMGLELAAKLSFLSMIVEMDKEDRVKILEQEVSCLQEKLTQIQKLGIPATKESVAVSDKTETVLASVNAIPADAVPVVTDLPWPQELSPESMLDDDFKASTVAESGANDEGGVLPALPSQASDDGFVPIDENSCIDQMFEGNKGNENIPVESSADENAPKSISAFSLPGGNVHMKDEQDDSVSTNNTAKEAPQLAGGFDDAGFGNAFSTNMFGSTGVSFF